VRADQIREYCTFPHVESSSFLGIRWVGYGYPPVVR
jgi:hypothetical protein